MDEKYILGVKISGTNKSQLLKEIDKKIKLGSKFSITTVGPELLLMSQKNNELKKALNLATFSVPDGIGLKLVEPTLEIIKGRELFLDLINLANNNSRKVFLLGGLENEAFKTANSLKNANWKMKIETAGGNGVSPNLSKDVVDKINNFSPDLLFIAFAHPEQELFITKYLNILNVKGIMTVGGTFNYISGNSKLPPKFLEGWGEWLWRLITEPKRIKRIFNATILFPIEVLRWKIKYLVN